MMCKHGDTVVVPIWSSNQRKMIGRDIDRCLVPLVKVLNAGGLETAASCCGHGYVPPSVILADDTWLVILTQEEAEKLYASYPTTITGEPKMEGYQ